VVLLHGLGSSAATWDRFAADLVAAGRQAIALDLRGHGTSPHADEYSFALMADDVLEFLAERGLTRIDLVGHSMGGMVALHLATGTLVRRLVIEDMAPAVVDGPAPDPIDFPEQPWQPVPFDWAAMRRSSTTPACGTRPAGRPCAGSPRRRCGCPAARRATSTRPACRRPRRSVRPQWSPQSR
jgi:pimeloyl-ACP methyl ester carboxylesterase